MTNLKLISASGFSALAGGFMVFRHADRIDSIGGLILIGFALVCMAPMQVKELREEASAAWKSFKNPS